MWKTCDCVVLLKQAAEIVFSFCLPFIALLMLSYPMWVWTYFSIWVGVEFWQVLSDKNFILVLYENKKQLGALTEKTTNLMSLHDWPYTFYFNDMKSMKYYMKRQYKRVCKIIFKCPYILKKMHLCSFYFRSEQTYFGKAIRCILFVIFHL